MLHEIKVIIVAVNQTNNVSKTANIFPQGISAIF